MSSFFDFIFHLDAHLTSWIQNWGGLTYGLLFLIIFCETGLVFTPFLPGDSLIFVTATLAGQGLLNLGILWVLFVMAAVGGDSLNYWVGTRFGRRLQRSSWMKPEHLQKTEDFYKKYGKKTIILARLVPVVRTVAPFVAGLGRMKYEDFLFYNVVGGVGWVTLFIIAGYFFGQITWVQDHLEAVALGIVALSFVPPAVEWMKGRKP